MNYKETKRNKTIKNNQNQNQKIIWRQRFCNEVEFRGNSDGLEPFPQGA